MKHRAVLIMFLVTSALSFTGCISFSAHPAGVEASAKHMDSPYYEVLGEAEGVSSSFRLFWVLPVHAEASIAEAVEDAIRKKGGDNLIEAVFTGERRVYIIGTVNNIYAKGKVIRYLKEQ